MDRPIPYRDEIKSGTSVMGLEKANYKTGSPTIGVVQDILTNKNYHPRGIKVRLTNGVILRVQKLLPPEDNNVAENAPVTIGNNSIQNLEQQQSEESGAELDSQQISNVDTSVIPEGYSQIYDQSPNDSLSNYPDNTMANNIIPETTLLDNSNQTGQMEPNFSPKSNVPETNSQVSEEYIQANIITPDESESEIHTTNAFIPSTYTQTETEELSES